jgi:septum formation topological specificity factor MinE
LSKKFNDVTKDYHKLMLPEQNLLNVISKYIGFNNNTLDNDEAFYDRFSIIHAQIMSGNDNIALKMEAKQYLLAAVNTNKISRSNYNQISHDLNL